MTATQESAPPQTQPRTEAVDADVTVPAIPHGGRVRGALEKYGLVLLLVVIFAFFAIFWDRPATFRSADNIAAVIGTYSVPMILALATIIPLCCGQFDLTVGPVAGLAAVVSAGALTRAGAPLWLTVLIVLLLGLVVGLINGLLIAYVKVSAFIVTLGMASVIIGIVTLYTDGATILVHNDVLRSIGSGNWFGIPKVAYFAILAAALVYYLLEHTPFGRYLYFIGSNENAARLVGLKVDRLVLLTFVTSGVLSAIAGLLLAARNGSADPQLGGLGLTLPALSAAFLGATAFIPGRFNALGTVVAVLFVGFSLSGMQLNNVTNWVTDFFTGTVLIVAVALSVLIGRSRAKRAS